MVLECTINDPSAPIQFTPPPEPVPALAVFTRTAAPGLTKTRLIPLLGARGAAALHAAMVADTLRKVESLPAEIARYVVFARAPIAGLPPHFIVRRQSGRDLGERLEQSFRALLRQHQSAVVIGTDSPLLPPRVLRAAFKELRISDAVLGPSLDGGYYLIGLRRQTPGLLRDVRWSTPYAYEDTLGNFVQHGYSCSVLEPCGDVDLPADVVRLKDTLRQDARARRLAPATWKFLKPLSDQNLRPAI